MKTFIWIALAAGCVAALLLTGCNSKMDARVTLLEYKLEEQRKAYEGLEKKIMFQMATNLTDTRVKIAIALDDVRDANKNISTQIQLQDERYADFDKRLKALEKPKAE